MVSEARQELGTKTFLLPCSGPDGQRDVRPARANETNPKQRHCYPTSMPKLDTGDTAWLLVSSALVLLMTPALALFYGGMVRRKNVLSTLMHSLAAIPIISVAWALFGYSLAFGPDRGGFIGGLDYAGMMTLATAA